MAWLALATMLLLWSAFSGAPRKMDVAAILSGLCILAFTLGGIGVYPARSEAVALVSGTVVSALALWLTGWSRSWARWAALFTGAGAGLFSLFGPAQGLFH